MLSIKIWLMFRGARHSHLRGGKIRQAGSQHASGLALTDYTAVQLYIPQDGITDDYCCKNFTFFMCVQFYFVL
jgi:hypothetical protein